MTAIQPPAASTASLLQLLGAGAFGALIGWYVYYINRYRKADVQLGDIVTLLGAIGGSAVLALFDKKTDLFGAYGIGLFVGFFGYFLMLLLFVLISWRKTGNFTLEWFLDGRRKDPPQGWGYPGGGAGPPQRPMFVDPTDHAVGR
jgi:hypothetical protein